MRLGIFILGVCALACSFAADAMSECLGPSPEATASVFFKKHRNFAQKSPLRLQAILSSIFYEALLFEYKCRAGEICAIDYDVWTAAQDGSIKAPVTFVTKTQDRSSSTVEMQYRFVLDKSRSKNQAAQIQLTRTGEDACWLVADVISPGGQSVLRTIGEYRLKYETRSNLPLQSGPAK